MDQSSLAAASSKSGVFGGGGGSGAHHHYQFSSNASPGSKSASGTDSKASGGQTSSPTPSQMEQILQAGENQIYVINIIHFVSQLCDNIVIASGGLLPLLAEATGGSKSQQTNQRASTGQQQQQQAQPQLTEGLTMAQANSLLYRLVNLVDTVVFSASHINLSELEADKNTTNGGILRQCLRLSCTVAVKNCLTVQSIQQRIISMGIGGNYTITSSDFPRDLFDNYHGCSIVSASELFINSALRLDQSDLVVDGEFSPHQTPNTGLTHSFLPFQTQPIRDANKLLQTIDVNRIHACIYRDSDPDSRQSQFLALASLYFISVLMVSKYRDIIEPKRDSKQGREGASGGQASNKDQPADVDIGAAISSNTTTISSGVSTTTSSAITAKTSSESHQSHIVTESDHYTISNQTSNSMSTGGGGSTTTFDSSLSGSSSASTSHQQQQAANSSISEMLTTRLETTLSSVCPLLRDIMCDFSVFLSRTLLGSYGQDLVSKEAVRTFKKPSTSPVELVMLLCSQEWQNTLQKNAGLTFIELINEGRILSHGMKDHIVRVAMEAEFILNRLRADDVAKHEHFNSSCVETQSTRQHEEALVNSLICSAKRRDYVLHNRFKETLINCVDGQRRQYKLDNWEDDDRRRRRFVVDSWEEDLQLQYVGQLQHHQQAAKSSSFSSSGSSSSSSSSHGGAGQASQLTPAGGLIEHPGLEALVTDEHHQIEVGHHENADCNHQPGDDCTIHSTQAKQQQQVRAAVARKSSSDCSDGDLAPSQETQASGGGGPNKQRDDVSRKSHDASNLASVGAPPPQQKLDGSQSGAQGDGHSSGDYLWADADDQGANFMPECESTSDFSGSVLFAAECSLIWNIYAIDGILQLTAHELYFEPHQPINDAIDATKRESKQQQQHAKTASDQQVDQPDCLHQPGMNSASGSSKAIRRLDLKVLKYCDFLAFNGKILLTDIRAVFTRHYLLQQTAIEIFLIHRTSVMFAFQDFDTVKRVIKFLPPVGVGIKYGIHQSRRASLMTPRQLFAASNMTQKWQKREISNFQYLIFLNTIAGRTYQDLNQYPVFPWILTNYDSQELDLTLPTNFRDLSKPVGALNNDRRQEFIERYQSWDNPKVPAFHYGTHYSTAAFTLSWMSRLRGQYHTAYMALQDGKYEDDSRLFLSLGDSWMAALVGGQQNVKELIPEFYYLPEIFNENFGLPPVELPPWAESPEHFVRLHRNALESELVSCQLHQWIDLIFGYKQRVPEAIRAINVFYYLTYQGNVNLNLIQDVALREAIETQIRHFGQTPSQLTTEPHPPRSSALHVAPLMFSPILDELCQVVKFPFNAPIVHISPCVLHNSSAASLGGVEGASTGANCQQINQQGPYSIVTITGNHQCQINKWHSRSTNQQPFMVDTLLGVTTTTAQASATANSTTATTSSNDNNSNITTSSSISNSSSSTGTSSARNAPSATSTGSQSSASMSATSACSSSGASSASGSGSGSTAATTTIVSTTAAAAAAAASKRQLIDINDMCSGVAIAIRDDYNHRHHHKHHHRGKSTAVVDEVVWSTTHHIVTLDGRHIIMGSFYDNSFRVFSTDHGKLSQVIYGHRGPITCMARSECNALADFYVATGSQDCSVLLWTWNAKYAQIEGSGVSAVHNPLPKLTISGHESPILSVLISAELGLLISGSRNHMLVHTTTHAECLVEIQLNSSHLYMVSGQCSPLASHNNNDHQHQSTSSGTVNGAPSTIVRPYVKDKQQANLEASMLGDDIQASSTISRKATVSGGATTHGKTAPDDVVGAGADATSLADANGTATDASGDNSARQTIKRKGRCSLDDVLYDTDYFVTNIRLVRELAFIACLAIPPPTKYVATAGSTSTTNTEDSGEHRGTGDAVSKSNNNKPTKPLAMLLTYNLRGVLMRSTTIGSESYPRLGDCCILQTTRDGEHLILTDSPTVVKVIRTFDLQPVYTIVTTLNPVASCGSPSMPQELNRVRSLSLVEHKYILVGLDNGKVIVYNIDFKNL